MCIYKDVYICMHTHVLVYMYIYIMYADTNKHFTYMCIHRHMNGLTTPYRTKRPTYDYLSICIYVYMFIGMTDHAYI